MGSDRDEDGHGDGTGARALRSSDAIGKRAVVEVKRMHFSSWAGSTELKRGTDINGRKQKMEEKASDRRQNLHSSEHVIDKIQMDYCKGTHTFAANFWSIM